MDTDVQRDVFRGGYWVSWNIKSGRPLPEAYGLSTDDTVKPSGIVALLFEVEVEVAQEAMIATNEYGEAEQLWPEYLVWSCRRYSLCITDQNHGDPVGIRGCEVRLLPGDIILREESERTHRLAISAGEAQLEFPYPLKDAVYTTRWWHAGVDSILPATSDAERTAGNDPDATGRRTPAAVRSEQEAA